LWLPSSTLPLGFLTSSKEYAELEWPHRHPGRRGLISYCVGLVFFGTIIEAQMKHILRWQLVLRVPSSSP